MVDGYCGPSGPGSSASRGHRYRVVLFSVSKFHSRDQKANSPNRRPYKSLLAIPEYLVLYRDNIS